MKPFCRPFVISFVAALLHCIIGNWLARFDTNIILECLFLPYTFIAGLSNFAGWDSLSLILEIVSLATITIILYPFALAFSDKGK